MWISDESSAPLTNEATSEEDERKYGESAVQSAEAALETIVGGHASEHCRRSSTERQAISHRF
jgi:hypothetical protein